MKKRTPRIIISAAAIAVLLLGILMGFNLSSLHANSAKASRPTPTQGLNKIQKRIVSGFAIQQGNDDSNDPALVDTKPPSNYYPDHADDQCALNLGSAKAGPNENNLKVNQNCLNLSDPDLQGRAQAQNETSIAEDPLNPSHIVATYNDYRRGDGTCGVSYSLDSGSHWNDATLPNEFTRGTAFGGVAREYWQAAGDPSVAWDTKGNAYYSCQVFERGPGTTNNPDESSAVYIFRSTQNNGASWNFPGRPVIEAYVTPTNGSTVVLEDKPYMTVDNHVGSPYQDRIYVTWTEFATDGTAYIYESHSNDYGETFSTPVVVSTTSSLCPNTYGLATPHGTCNENQFSDPFTGSDGALYVVYNNYNNSVSGPNDNHNQFLLSKSTDGGNTFSAPVLVSNYYDLPDCATYTGQDAGRACVPDKGSTQNSYFRATNYASGGVNPKNPSQVVVTFGSYINEHSNESNGCIPAGFSTTTGQNLYTGVTTPGACNNDILESISNNGGTTFSGATTDPRTETDVTTASGQATTDQFWQWEAFTTSGKLAVSYYDRQYGSDETTGYSDISLSGSTSDIMHFGITRVTSSSNPPPTEFSGLFMGDYSGLTAVTSAYPFWTDTRDRDLFLCPGTGTVGVPPAVCTGSAPNAPRANDQDVFEANVSVP